MLPFRWKTCAVFILAVVAACSGPAGKDDPAVKRDFDRYRKQLAKVIDIENDALASHKTATDDKTLNDSRYAVFLASTFLPRYETYYKEVSRIHPTTDEIIGLHKLYLRRTALIIESFKDIGKSAQTGNAALLQSAREKDAESDRLGDRWAQRVEELNKRYK